MEFKLTDEYIELIKLLKKLQIAESGGHAKMMVEDGMVTVNGQTEYRKRAKLHDGAVVLVNGQTIRVIS